VIRDFTRSNLLSLTSCDIVYFLTNNEPRLYSGLALGLLHTRLMHDYTLLFFLLMVQADMDF